MQVGKYLISPLIRRCEQGFFEASVSIRSGRGSMTHDRIMRFIPAFSSPDRAARFAVSHALRWLGPAARAASASHLIAHSQGKTS